MKNSNPKRTEFDWEKEIRKDEVRIHAYMQELRNYIDLPNEEEIILKKIMKRPELITQKAELENISLGEMFDDFDDDFFLGEDWQKKEGADCYMLLEKLAYQWCVIFSSELSPEDITAGINIICMLGRLMARTADVLEMDIEEYPSLKVAICKRIINDINTLAGTLGGLRGSEEKLSEVIDNHLSHLYSIREKLIDLIQKIRESGDKKDKK